MTYAHISGNYYINPAVTPMANRFDELLYPISPENVPGDISLSITATKSLEWNGMKYIGSNSNGNSCDLTIAIRGGYSQQITDVALNGTTIAQGDGTYTLQPSIGSASEFVVTVTATPTGINGKGTEDEPYIIDTQERWGIFADLVSTGHPSAGFYFRLDNDITVTTMAGAPSPPVPVFEYLGTENAFSGIFDGNSHTLTLDYNANEEFAAPFRYIYEATIKNLHVAGAITTSARFAAGIIGHAAGNSYLNNCRSSVLITHSSSLSGIYDLQGRKIDSSAFNIHSSLPKGIYIIKGKKVVIK